jgi:hypothetical protein
MSKALPGAVLAVLVGVSASAQDKGAVGVEALVGSSKATVGVRWHISKRFALRPSIAFSRTTSTQNTTVYADNTSAVGSQDSLEWTLGGGLTGVYYLTTGDAVSTYLGVSYAYNYQSDTVNPLLFPPIDTLDTPDLGRIEAEASVFPPGHTTGSQSVVGALFGVQHPLSKKVTIFGEVGIDYAFGSVHQEVQLPPGQTTAILNGSGSTQNTLISYTAGLGIIFYLK